MIYGSLQNLQVEFQEPWKTIKFRVSRQDSGLRYVDPRNRIIFKRYVILVQQSNFFFQRHFKLILKIESFFRGTLCLSKKSDDFSEVRIFVQKTIFFFFLKNTEYLPTKSNYFAEVLYINLRNLFFSPEVCTLYQSKKPNYFSEAR